MPALDNRKHELFAQGLAKGQSQLEAYRNAGYKPDDGAAARLSGNVRVKARLAELQERGAARTEVTLESLIEEAGEIQRAAMKDGQHSAAVAALTAKAKLAGQWVDRSENENTNVNYAISDELPTEDEWAAERAKPH